MSVTAGLRAMLGKLVPYRVNFEHTDYASSSDHVETMDLNSADVISSQLKVGEAARANVYRLTDPDSFALEQAYDLHHIVIDVDLPAHLVESSTPGHHHLYVELDRPVTTEAYFEWLEASAKIGLVEPGYVAAFKDRGFSCVRLPWVQKEEPTFKVIAVPDDTPAPQTHIDMVDAVLPHRSTEIPTEDLRFD